MYTFVLNTKCSDHTPMIVSRRLVTAWFALAAMVAEGEGEEVEEVEEQEDGDGLEHRVDDDQLDDADVDRSAHEEWHAR